MATRDLKIYMPTAYNSSYEDMGKRVRDKYATGDEQTKLQWAWLRLKNVMTIEQFRALDVTFAEAMDGAWAYEAPGNLLSGYQNIYSKVILPKGRFLQNANGNLPRGGMIGEGSFGYGGNGADQGQVASEFEARPDEWLTPGERRMWSTPNADRTDNMAYNEGLDLWGVRLTLPIKKGDGITRVGWYLKRLGSTSYINAIQANGGSKGFVFVDGVPAVVGTIRAFYSDVAGASFEGTWGADITITKLECDGCVRPFQVLNTSDGNGGGVLRIGLKVEDGVTANIPWPGSYCYLEGQYDVEVSMNASFKGGVVPAQGALFVVKPTIVGSDGKDSLQGSRLRVSGKGFGYGKVLKNLVTGRVIEGAGDYQGFSFEHYANGDKFHSNCPTLVNDQRADAPTPPPVQPPVIPPTTPGTLVFKTAFGGTDKMKLVATSGATLTGTRGLQSIASNVGTTNAYTYFPLPATTISKLVLLGITIITPVDWSWLNGLLRLKNSTAAKTTLYIDKTGAAVQDMTIGVRYSRIEVPFPAGTTIDNILGSNGNTCPTMKLEGIEVYS